MSVKSDKTDRRQVQFVVVFDKVDKITVVQKRKVKICAVFVTFVVFDRLSVANFPSVYDNNLFSVSGRPYNPQKREHKAHPPINEEDLIKKRDLLDPLEDDDENGNQSI